MKIKMIYGNREVIDLSVFDENGKLVAILNSLKDSQLVADKNPCLYIKDAILNTELLEILNFDRPSNSKENESPDSDYSKESSNFSEYETVVFNPRKERKCKLIARTEFREESGSDKNVYYEIPCASGRIIFESVCDTEPIDFDIMFEIMPFNENGDTFKVHIEK